MIGKQRLKSIILMKEKRLFLLISSIFITFIISISNTYLKVEDSDLKEMVDSQGNVYRVDEQGKIYTDGLPHPERQSATIENLSYYFNQSMALEGNGYLEEAMQMYYEILSLPKVNQSVVITRVAISARIKRLYADTSKRDLVLKYFDVRKLDEGDAIQYKNEKFKFSFRYPSSWQISKEVIEDKQRKAAFISLMAPALLDNEGTVVDVSLGLLAEDISSYAYRGKIQSSEYADIWHLYIGNKFLEKTKKA